jgi:hypothetical protein
MQAVLRRGSLFSTWCMGGLRMIADDERDISILGVDRVVSSEGSNTLQAVVHPGNPPPLRG